MEMKGLLGRAAYPARSFSVGMAGVRRSRSGTLSISVGVAHRLFRHQTIADSSYRDADEGEVLFRAADRALYTAKGSGRNCVYSTVVSQSQDIPQRKVVR